MGRTSLRLLSPSQLCTLKQTVKPVAKQPLTLAFQSGEAVRWRSVEARRSGIKQPLFRCGISNLDFK